MALSAVEEHGFAIFPEMFLTREVTALTDKLRQSILRRSKAGVRHALGHPAVAAIARDERLLRIAREVLGTAAVPFHATLFDKSSTANWLVTWHQDTALPLRERRDAPG